MTGSFLCCAIIYTGMNLCACVCVGCCRQNLESYNNGQSSLCCCCCYWRMNNSSCSLYTHFRKQLRQLLSSLLLLLQLLLFCIVQMLRTILKWANVLSSNSSSSRSSINIFSLSRSRSLCVHGILASCDICVLYELNRSFHQKKRVLSWRLERLHIEKVEVKKNIYELFHSQNLICIIFLII